MWSPPTTADSSESKQPDKRALGVEIVIVLAISFGWSGLSAALSLLQTAVSAGGLAHHTVTLNPSRSTVSVIDLAWQLLAALRLLGWGALGVYLLWRSGIRPGVIGLTRARLRSDGWYGLALAAVIGLPGLGLYLGAHALGVNVTIVPSGLRESWWRIGALVVAAIANAAAEEIVVVGYLLTRLRQLSWSDRRALAASASLRGSYHLYQGLGGGLGNLVMGVVFGKFWQRTTHLWPLIIAHALIDSVAYIGYAILHNFVSWLP